MQFTKPMVLLVEDNEVVSFNTAVRLENLGYEVVVAFNAQQAEAELSQRVDAFQAALVDVNLGEGPSGYDFALAARRMRSALPIVFTTADAAGAVFAEYIGRAAHVGKPYTFAQLEGALSRVAA